MQLLQCKETLRKLQYGEELRMLKEIPLENWRIHSSNLWKPITDSMKRGKQLSTNGPK